MTTLTIHNDGDSENSDRKEDASAKKKHKPHLALCFLPFSNPTLAPCGRKVNQDDQLDEDEQGGTDKGHNLQKGRKRRKRRKKRKKKERNRF